MKVEDFKEISITSDVSFNFNGKEYFIFLLNDGYNVGQYDNNLDLVFGKYKSIDENFSDMFENWIIEGKPIKELLNEIEINY